MNMLVWEYDPNGECWLAGSPFHGCGVVRNPKDSKWYANVIIFFKARWYGPFESSAEGKLKAEAVFGSHLLDHELLGTDAP